MLQVIQKINQKSLYTIYSAIIIAILSVVLINLTYADESSNVNYSVTVEPALNITTSSNKVSLDLNPLNHDFDSQDLTVSVSTNNETGYKLYVNTDSTKLIEKDDNTLYIDTLSSEVNDNNFTANRWGYKLDSSSTNFSPFSPGTLVLSSKTIADGKNTDDITTMVFAAKVGYETKAGTYALALNFQATANPHIYEIQNLDSNLCTEDPMAVIDNRDGQEYVIQKLKDNNCWMMTNLNLGAKDLQVVQLDSSNTNIGSTITAATFSSWKKSASSSTYTSSEYIPVSGEDSYNGLPYGTLYNYCATSGNDSRLCVESLTSQPSPMYDICPAGWRLPTSGAADSSTNEFNNLYTLTNYNTNAKMRASYTDGGAAFVLAGNTTDGEPHGQGSDGIYWSSTWNNNSTNMYRLRLGTSDVVLAGSGTRARGFSIRCILK